MFVVDRLDEDESSTLKGLMESSIIWALPKAGLAPG